MPGAHLARRLQAEQAVLRGLELDPGVDLVVVDGEVRGDCDGHGGVLAGGHLLHPGPGAHARVPAHSKYRRVSKKI